MMRIAEALEAFRLFREEAIVVPGRGGRCWIDQTTHPELDVPLGDPAMGGHAGFGLGLALARPERKVVLFDSEGDILMSLGMLVTIAEQAPANFYHFLLDNECYATTGGQPVPNAKNIAYDKLALAARLSENGKHRVLLLEAGDKDRIFLDPRAGRLQPAVRRPAAQLDVRKRAGGRARRSQHVPAARQGVGRHQLDQRHGLYARQ